MRYSMVSWNARALLARDGHKFRLKQQFFHAHLINKYSIICIQEVHGTPADISLYMHPYSNTHRYWFSPGPDSATGGILIIISNEVLAMADADPIFQTHATGRIAHLFLSFDFGQLWIWNFHDFGVSSEDSKLASNIFKEQLRLSSLDPLRNILVATGDFNRSRNDNRFYIDPLDQAAYAASPSLHSQNRSQNSRVWDSLFDQMVEIETHEHTHYSAEGHYENAIDRIFWTFPSWASRLINISKPTSLPAHSMHMKGLSDHSPVGFIVTPHSSTPPHADASPPGSLGTPIFGVFFANLRKITKSNFLP